MPSLHGTVVVPPACSGVHLGLAPLQCSGWRHRDPLQQAGRVRGSQHPRGALGTRNDRDTPATPPCRGRGYDGRNPHLLLLVSLLSSPADGVVSDTSSRSRYKRKSLIIPAREPVCSPLPPHFEGLLLAAALSGTDKCIRFART